MTTIECFACGKTYNESRRRRNLFNECPRCGWAGGDGISEDDPRYLVMLSLAQRAEEVKDKVGSSREWMRLEPSAREYAVLEHGDQIRVEDERWRITAKTDGIFWMRRFAIVLGDKKRAYIGHPDDKGKSAMEVLGYEPEGFDQGGGKDA